MNASAKTSKKQRPQKATPRAKKKGDHPVPVITLPHAGAEPLEEYMRQVNEQSPDAHPYDRLMIALRKAGQYQQELEVIKKGISMLGKQAREHAAGFLARLDNSGPVKRLSAQLNKQLGLVDKKGNDIYQAEPMNRWLKRKEVVEKKINSSKARKK